jgi:thiol-disulfide isomerase/thioredoxin
LPLFRSLKLAVLGCAVLAAGCHEERDDSAQPQASASAPAQAEALAGVLDTSHRGSTIPEFTLTDAAGKRTPLASFRGKPLLVNLWATWCAPCIAELPTLDKLAADRAGALKVVTVSQDMSQTEKVAPFLKARGISHLEPWLDPKNDLAFHYEAGTLPTTIYYDARGREVWRFVGGHDWTSAETAKMLAAGTGS